MSSSPTYETQYAYSGGGRLKIVKDPNAPTANQTAFTYDSRNDIVLEQYNAVGMYTWLTYDNAGSLSNVYNRHGSPCGYPCPPASVPTDSNPIADYSYSRDVGGRATSETRSGGSLTTETSSYTYDAVGRLATATLPDNTLRRYEYDSDSNRVAMRETPSGGSEQLVGTYTYDPSTTAGVDELTSSSVRGTTTSYGYTSDGQVSARGSDTLSWDGNGRLGGGSFGGTTIAYTYDALGRLQSRTSTNPTTTARYLYVGTSGEARAETDASGNITRFNVGGPLGVFKQYSGPPTSSTSAVYLFYDGHGNLAATTTEGGTRTAAYTYDPFGAPNQTAPASSLTALWVGRWQKKFDAASSLILMGARPYDPMLGRFLAVDPVDSGSLNAYDYANQDPINGLDLTGREYDELRGGGGPIEAGESGAYRDSEVNPGPRVGRLTRGRLRIAKAVLEKAAQDPTRHDLGMKKILRVLNGGELTQNLGKYYQQYEVVGKRGTYQVGGRWYGNKFLVTHAFYSPIPRGG